MMADLQIIEEMNGEDRTFVRRSTLIKNWIIARKFQLTFAAFTVIAFIVLDFHHQSRFEDIEEIQNILRDMAKNYSQQFDGKVIELERNNSKRFEEQDTELKSVQKGLAEIESKRISKLEEKVKNTDFHASAASAQSCQELYNHGFTKSGYYLVDPDGRYSGQSSFEVFCKFYHVGYSWDQKLRIETVLRPKNSEFEISSSRDKDFKADVRYNATTNQIASLITNSICYQEITFKCLVMPLHYEATNHGYWKDRSGTERYFFDGYDFKGRNCKCSNTPDEQCQNNANALCNCDMRSKYDSEDKGKITSDWILPMTEVGYKFHGHSLNTFNAQNGSATIIIGDLVCRDNLDLKVKSVDDLKGPINKVFWNNWEDFVFSFDIEFLKEKIASKYVFFTHSWVIFKAEEIARDSPELYTEIKYDAKEAKLTFTQNTLNGTKIIEVGELELNKKIYVNVQTSKIYFDRQQKNYFSPDGGYYYRGNELKSKKTQVTISHPDDRSNQYFKVTNFSIRNVKED